MGHPPLDSLACLCVPPHLTNDGREISGVYFFGGNGRTLSSSALSYSTKFSKELWATSCDLFLELQHISKGI
ncbi:unnamed protein product [Ilex paraguariensis]|uniref:Uncharacterized protein n=1 Tax=Ilex paraguariensis TaxID=185542 RepID=A0ABC8RF47_9AQUA